MPTKPIKPTPTSAIKWTEEEWSKIATHLYAVKGPGLLTSENLEEIKARDVFDAQEVVLPPERHRKLVSVAQGFQAIRDRLRAIYRNKAQAQQEDLFRGKQRPVQVASPATSGPDTQDDDASETEADNDGVSGGDVDDVLENMRIASAPLAHGESNQSEQATATEGTPAPAQDLAGKQDQAGNSAGASTSTSTIPPGSADARRDALPRTRAEHKKPSLAWSEQREGKSANAHAGPVAGAQRAQAAANFIDAARPFIAMVCEEFARALVGVLAESGPEKTPRASTQGPPRQAVPRQDSPEFPEHPRARMQAGAGEAANAAVGQAVRQNRIEASEDENGYHAEVQPLFDPKLPPSANSEFKPTIGLVGASDHDALELQELYPQLQLVAVRADAIKRADVFQRCQRVIGLRDQIPPPTDDFLGRSLRHRYVRISGGIDRVREQLNTWLNKPGTLKSGPGAPMNRNNAKGPGTGPKKRQYRRMG